MLIFFFFFFFEHYYFKLIRNFEHYYFGFGCLLELSFCFLGVACSEGSSIVGTLLSTSMGVVDGVDYVAAEIDAVADVVDGVTFAASHAAFPLW